MRFIDQSDIFMSARAQVLVSQADMVCETDPEMCEVAAMVYVGDVYSLRDQNTSLDDNGWGGRCYVCDIGADPL